MKTLFIDADDGFSTIRLSQMAGRDVDSVAQSIILFKPRSFQEQCILIENLENFVSKKVALIVVDTITSLYRVELGGLEETFALNRGLNRQLAYLVKIAKDRGVALLLTSQVHSVLNEIGVRRIEPVAERVLKFWSQSIMRLKSSQRPGIREALIERHLGFRCADAHVLFKLTDCGLMGVG